jgi:hypothetical protein
MAMEGVISIMVITSKPKFDIKPGVKLTFLEILSSRVKQLVLGSLRNI